MVFRAKAFCHACRRFQFDSMPLAIIEREAVAIESLRAGDGEAGGRIETAAQ
jgi:hypothetical protein